MASPRGQSEADAHLEHVRKLRQNVETPDVGKRRYLELGHTLSTRIDAATKATTELEENLAKVRSTANSQMNFLKDLELERIDLRRDFQKLAAAHHNWRNQHHGRGLSSQDAIDAKLTEEQQNLEEEIKALDGHIVAVSTNIHRLREMREMLEWKIADKKRHIDVDSTVLSARREPLEMPRTLRRTLPQFRDAPGPYGHKETGPGQPWRYLHESWESKNGVAS